jgi:general secretion pathway protein G
MTRRNPSLQRGFTLIEIMVAVVIIGILGTVVAINVLPNLGKASIAAAKQDIRGLESALGFYKLDNLRYPTTEQGLRALVEKPADPELTNWDGPYLKSATSAPKDPWKRDYIYEYPGTHGGEFDVFTLGADGQPGGEKDNADIGNWNLER